MLFARFFSLLFKLCNHNDFNVCNFRIFFHIIPPIARINSISNVLLRVGAEESNSKYNTGRKNQVSRRSVKMMGMLLVYDVANQCESASPIIKHTPMHK